VGSNTVATVDSLVIGKDFLARG